MEWEDLPSKPGMGLHDEGLASLFNSVLQMQSNGRVTAMDVSGWDWCMHGWEFDADLERRIDLCNGVGTVWEKVIRNHFYCMKNKIFLLSDGRMFAQALPGVMPSGWYNTSGTNSFIRCLDHYVMCAALNHPRPPSIMAMSDDSLETAVIGALHYYQEFLGKRVKDPVDVVDDKFSFCSHFFPGNAAAVPLNVDKVLVRFLHSKPQSFDEALQLYEQLLYVLRHHPDISKIKQLLVDCGWNELYLATDCETGKILQSGVHETVKSHCVPSCNGPKSLLSANQNAERLHGSPLWFTTMYSPL